MQTVLTKLPGCPTYHILTPVPGKCMAKPPKRYLSAHVCAHQVVTQVVHAATVPALAYTIKIGADWLRHSMVDTLVHTIPHNFLCEQRRIGISTCAYT